MYGGRACCAGCVEEQQKGSHGKACACSGVGNEGRGGSRTEEMSRIFPSVTQEKMPKGKGHSKVQQMCSINTMCRSNAIKWEWDGMGWDGQDKTDDQMIR